LSTKAHLWRLFSRTVYRGILLLFAHKSRVHKQRKVRRGEVETEDRRQGSEKRLKTREKNWSPVCKPRIPCTVVFDLMKRLSQSTVATRYAPSVRNSFDRRYIVKKVYQFSRPPPEKALIKLSLDRNNLIITVSEEFG
jgi:hypothetical protein